MGRESLTVLLPQVIGDQEWEEKGDQMVRDYLTLIFLPQVTGGQKG
jgi:hypothetical protein